MLKRIVLVLAIMLVAQVPALAQEPSEPVPTPTPHWETAPSLPVKGTPVKRHPGQPGPAPGVWPNHEHLVGITIAGYPFMMKPGWCAFKVEAAIQAHDDLFTGEKACDAKIRQARAIQRQKEAEDPSYANEPRVTPAPTPSKAEQSEQ